MRENEITFKQLAHIGVLAQYPTGWTKEVNIVSWNGGIPKVDIRDWDKAHEHMSRGITITGEELQHLIEAVNARDAVGLMKDFNKPPRSNDIER